MSSFHDKQTVRSIADRFPVRYFLRLRTMYLSECLPFFLVLRPSAGLPQGVTGALRPIGDFPSPPPCG